jgi:hypothetical protein
MGVRQIFHGLDSNFRQSIFLRRNARLGTFTLTFVLKMQVSGIK